MAKRSFPNLGWDPTPGDVEQTRELAKKLGGLAAELGRAVGELGGIDTGEWKGETARAFSDHVSGDVTPLVKKGHESFHKASRALHRWAGQLEGFQREADRLERAAGAHGKGRGGAKAGHGDVGVVPGEVWGEGPGGGSGGASNAVSQGLLAKVRDLEERYGVAALLICGDLDMAGVLAPAEPGFFSELAHGVEGAWDDTVDWVKDHADVVALVGDLLSDLTGVLGFLAIVTIPFEPLGAIFGAAALVTSGLALLAHSTAKAAGADVSWMSIGMDAIGLMPGIGALTSKEGVAVKDVATATVRAGKFGKGFSGLKYLVTKSNTLALGEMSSKVQGGFKIPKLVAIGGEYKDIGLIRHASTGRNMLAGLSEAGYHQGQWVGTKGLKLFSGKRLDIDPEGIGGRSLDALLRIGPKVAPGVGHLPQHVGEAVHPGDRFHHAANSR